MIILYVWFMRCMYCIYIIYKLYWLYCIHVNVRIFCLHNPEGFGPFVLYSIEIFVMYRFPAYRFPMYSSRSLSFSPSEVL